MAPEQRRFSASDGVSIAWDEWAPHNEGPPVFLCHGYGIDARTNWVGIGVVDALVATGRRVVAVHTRGHGDSDKPHDSRFYGEDRMALDVSELIDILSASQIDLVGYSMGAVVALIVASREQRVRRLVAGGLGESAVVLGGIDTRVLPGHAIVEAMLAEEPSKIGHPAAQGMRTFIDAVGSDRVALAALARVFHATPIALDAIAAPTLVMVGDQDPLAQSPEVLVAAIPNGRLAIKVGDHTSVAKDPTFASTLCEFLCLA
jgi:pimeloyl-ACP methyl ester carboxylesterase